MMIKNTIRESSDHNSGNSSVGEIIVKQIFLVLLCFSLGLRAFTQVSVTTIANPPVNPVLSNYVSTNVVSTFMSTDQFPTNVSGKITCMSPTFFSIELKPSIRHQVLLFKGPNPLSIGDKANAFGNFFVDSLDISTGVDIASITDGTGRINKLPDGTYNICFSAIDFNNMVISTGCATFTIGCGSLINTIITSPINPVIANSVTSGIVNSTIQIRNPAQCVGASPPLVKLFGKIDCLSPSPFTISLNPNYDQQTQISVPLGAVKLSSKLLIEAFGNFNDANLVTTGIDLASIKDANNNIKLPTGNYRICFYARYFNPTSRTLGGNASDPNLGCATFNICSKAEGAPQFTTPINNMNINSAIAIVQPASPVIFTWTPPQSTCGLPPGGFTYDFEVRELFNNQNVNDALNNPYVFRKTLVPSTTFLLDTNLYKGVLQSGKRYAVRVRAVSNNPTSGFEIDNGGYSRIEAFQYGGNVITQNGMPNPQDYYIQFEDRKCGYWSEVYNAYKRHTRSDTLVPIKEYIAFALTENGTAYNVDAIDLFLALNPDLADLKKVKISYSPKLPEFPRVPANDLESFGKDHIINLEPDNIEKSKFLKYLDTLNLTKAKVSGDAGKTINDLAGYLNGIKLQVDSIDRVTVNLVNSVMSELLYELRQNSKGFNKAQYNQLQNLNTALRDLTASSPYSTSFLYPIYSEKQSLSSYQSSAAKGRQKISLTNYPLKPGEADDLKHILAAIMKQLLPYDVIVFRSSTVAPYKPVLDAPDLAATYRIFYTLSILYNHKNPDINAKSTGHLASTVQISLPSNSVFTFWTLNMLNHKMTKAVDVDLKNVLSEMQKLSIQSKKLSIVLKVE
jgi:hypothetical protein